MSASTTLWRRLLIYTHRWLGIAGSLLFVVWFVSGIVMMYAGMPSLTTAERLSRVSALDLSRARLDVSEAAVRVGVAPRQIVVGMLGDRPVYRFTGAGGVTTVYADTGTALAGLDAEEAVALALGFAPEHAATTRYDTRLRDPDQWTLQSRAYFPLHRVRLGDDADTVLYVSDRTGEPVMRTTRQTRRWGYVGAVLHWLYFTPLRSRGALWSDLVIWLSVLGCVLCLSGLVWGLWRVASSKAYRLRGGPSHSPYAGLMRWHHYTGLVFGLVTFTWVFSGALSMDPWSWHPGTGPTRVQREVVTGGSLRLGPLTVERLRAGIEAVVPSFVPKELEVVQLLGEPYLLAQHARHALVDDVRASLPNTLAGEWTHPLEQQLVSVAHPERGAFSRFEDGVFDALATAVMPGVDIIEATWLRAYDSYYYDRSQRRRLPVLRVRYDDPQRTWLYFDPHRGAIARKEERLTRLNRWLYHGLHSLDFPFLYDRRPLWDVVVILLSLGGITLSVTSLTQGWRRLRRHARRFFRFSGRAVGWLRSS